MIRVLSVLVMAGLLTVEAAAHQQKLSVTTITKNDRSGMMEIMHQIPVHDAEHALRFINDDTSDIIADEASQAAFAQYITERFEIRVNDQNLSLDYVGSELAGGSIWVYQEASPPDEAAIVTISSQILTDIWARQENRVNIGQGKNVRTLIFKAGSGFQTVLE